MPQAAIKPALEEQTADPAVFTDLVLGARLEFHLCLQLLSERARFVTGASWAAIALREEERFVYRAATGLGAPEIGTAAAIGTDFSTAQPRFQQDRKSLLGAILRDDQVVGLIQLSSDGFEFPDEDWGFVARISELIKTAIDQLEAAEHSRGLILAEVQAERNEPEWILNEVLPAAKAPAPLVWHAPEGAQPRILQKPYPETTNIAVRLCESCGFPVSPGRKICVDCEEHRVIPAPVLFNSESPASWISSHGYSIASLLVPAIAAAIYYWLR
ncbi:MAG TPA: hypothetical protein VJO35_04335 [Terriglobales bacterium]|nr:hypothetical protein [Terriglobales bacterium]